MGEASAPASAVQSVGAALLKTVHQAHKQGQVQGPPAESKQLQAILQAMLGASRQGHSSLT